MTESGNQKEVQLSFGGLVPKEPEAPVPEEVADVAVAVPIAGLLSYSVSEELSGRLVPGVRVKVPIGPREVTGFVVNLRAGGNDDRGLKAVSAVLESRASLTDTTLKLGLWISKYYGAGPGETLQAMVPAAVRKGRKQPQEIWLVLGPLAEVRAYIQKHGEKKSAAARIRILELLIRNEGKLQHKDVVEHAQVSASPISTLEKLGLVVRKRVAKGLQQSNRGSEGQGTDGARPKTLSEDQAAALEALLPHVDSGKHHAALLHGVTGSGKTEVYLRLMEATLSRGRDCILLVPEIALTPQTVQRIRARIPEVAVLHSNLSEGERAEQWETLRSGKVKVAVGPRSAVFAPLHKVGLIVVDEEHETTFKQNSAPRYHARDVALHRGSIEGALVVLGTATPSMESEGLARRGRLQRLSLPRRIAGRPLPPISVIDMRHEKPVGPGGIFSRSLIFAMEETLNAGEQIMLFLNRRGFSTIVLCRVCGWKATCDHCAIQLTHYQGSDRLLCHYCAAEKNAPLECPDCKSHHVRYSGFGTEKVEEAVKGLFPGRVIARMDGETLQKRGAPERLYQDLKEGRIDVLVGTQSLAKGFDIPNVTLVGVISADTALLIPDFRSSERTFQLLCQVAGRAGRGQQPGKVLIQSYCPEHEAIQAAAKHDHERFAALELSHRAALSYPPSGSLLRIVVESQDSELAAKTVDELALEARSFPEVVAEEAQILGPAPCPIPQLKGQHRFHFLLMAKDKEVITQLVARAPRRRTSKIRVLIDRDPVALM